MKISQVIRFAVWTSYEWHVTVAAMFSARFKLPIIISVHAKIRMVERDVSEAILLDVIDCGETRYKDSTHLWTFKEFPERDDNLLCAVLVLEDCVIVKTVMHHFSVL